MEYNFKKQKTTENQSQNESIKKTRIKGNRKMGDKYRPADLLEMKYMRINLTLLITFSPKYPFTSFSFQYFFNEIY